MEAGPFRLLQRADAYYRTAKRAYDDNDFDPAYENFRTAAELAAKALLQWQGVPYARTHNIGGTLAKAGLWPRGEKGHKMAAFLASSTKAVYGFVQDVEREHVLGAATLCEEMLEIARRKIRESRSEDPQ